jgi:hypothetical protein
VSQCPQCGTPTQPDQAFCGMCGTGLASAQADQTMMRPALPRDAPPLHPAPPAPYDAPTAQFPVTPPPTPSPQQPHASYAAPAAGHAGIDLSRFLQSPFIQANWGGAAKVAGAMFGVAAVLSLGFGLLGSLDDFDFGQFIATSLLGIGSVFGVDTVQVLGDDAKTTTGHFPTLITVVTLGLGGLLFRRLTAPLASIRTGLADAARVSAVLTGLLFVLAVLLRIWHPDVTPSVAVGAISFSSSDKSYLDFVGAILQGFLLPFAVLALVASFRRDWLTEQAAVVRDWLLPVVHGAGALLLGLLAAGVVFVVAILLGNDDVRELEDVVAMLTGLPSLGLWLVGLGVGAEHGQKFKSDIADDESLQRLAGFADDNGALFWVAPLVAVALAAFAAYVVIARTRDRALVTRNVAVYVVSLLVVGPLLVRFANTHVHATGGVSDFSAFAGIDGFQTTMLFFLVSAVAAVVLLLVTGNLDLAHLQAKASSLAQTVKESSGQQKPPAPASGSGPTQQPPPPGSVPPGPPPGWQPPPAPPGWPGQPGQPGPVGPPPGWQPPPSQ